MDIKRLQAITTQVYELTRDLAHAEASNWNDVLSIHTAIATGFGFSIGRCYASCPSLEAKFNVAAMVACLDQTAQYGYEKSQVDVADWNLDRIVQDAARKGGVT